MAQPPPTTEPHLERPGPAEFSDPLVRREIAKATVWFGMALLIVGLIVLAQPLLLIVGGAIFAVFLDGGVRLIGRVLPIPRGWRLLLVILLGFGFLGWVAWYAGTTIAAQFEALRLVVTEQFQRLLAFAASLGLVPSGQSANLGAQLLGSVGRLTSAVGSAIGAVASVIAMIVIGIFLAAEPRIYDRGIAWMLPLRHRARFYRIAAHVGFTLRRLLFGRLVGMMFEGVFTWVMLSLGGVPMAGLLGLVTGVLAFIPNIGAITSGILMVAVGFSAGPHQGVYAIFVYFFVQNIDGYLVVPVHRPPDRRPRARDRARHAAADGRIVRDSRRAVRRPHPGDVESGAGRPQPARGGDQARRAGTPPPADAYCWGGPPCVIAAALGTTWTTLTSIFEVGVGRDRAAWRRLRAIAQPGRDMDIVPAASCIRLSASAKPGMVWLDEQRDRALALAAVEQSCRPRAALHNRSARRPGQSPSGRFRPGRFAPGPCGRGPIARRPRRARYRRR